MPAGKNRERRAFVAGGVTYEYVLERKKIKRINLRVHADGTLYVSMPLRAPIGRVEAFLQSETPFIDRARERLREQALRRPAPFTAANGETVPIDGISHTVSVVKGKKQEISLSEGVLTLAVRDPADEAERLRVLRREFACLAETVITEEAEKLWQAFRPVPPAFPTLCFRAMKSKWGVCRPTEGRITFNTRLLFLPRELRTYVICHEFAHFTHPDHSPDFWRFLSRFLPDCKERRKQLNAFPIPEGL